MARMLALLVLSASSAAHARGIGASTQQAMLQTWDAALDGANAKDTPVTRVVKLLKEMQHTLQKDMDEDEELYDKLACWCNNNGYEKNGAISAGEAKIADLQSSIESLTARSAELKTRIQELEADVASDKNALAEATALREKQLKKFHGAELDSVQAIENLKAALEVLSKHHVPESTNWHAFLSVRSDGVVEADIVEKALKSGSAFMQARHGYSPSYSSASGEIVGILKQLKEEMEGDLSESQKRENARAAAFAELRAAKTSEIESGEKMAESKEDELANTDNALAEAKEDLGQEEAALSENQKFLMNLKTTCAEADKNFAERKKARLQEIQAVAETITILTGDEARDAMSGTYNLFQVSADKELQDRRHKAAAALRRAAVLTHQPQLSILASTVELDAFTRVKKAIDDMIASLNTQQADEVKKNDWCKSEIQENEMTSAKAESHKSDLETKENELASNIDALSQGVEDAKAQIAQLQVDLQRANEDRVKANLDFQKTVADQTATIEVLHKALDRLATFYDKENLLQRSRQTPPVPQMEYKASAGSSGVMQMIEKLIFEAKGLTAESRKSEGEAQAGYEALVADTNRGVAALSKEVITKTKAKAEATKEKQETAEDIADTATEIEKLNEFNGNLHGDCDYLLHNFDARQTARAQEVEALQQAKQILNGANLS